jgi:hypothetical protein
MSGLNVLRPVNTYDMLAATDREFLLNENWLAAFLRPHCKCKTLGRGWRGTRLRLLQYPLEFARFLILMAQHQVKSYVEIGTSTGGTFMMADSYLRAAVPGYIRSVGYDRKSKLRDWEEYRGRFPSAEFRCQGSDLMDISGERFDAAFVDARHIDRWVMQDYGKVLAARPKLIGFHDILLARSTVCDAWAKIKTRHPVKWELVDSAIPEQLRWGIGVVKVDANAEHVVQ